MKLYEMYSTLNKPVSVTFKGTTANLNALVELTHRTCLINEVHISQADEHGDRDVTITLVPLPK